MKWFLDFFQKMDKTKWLILGLSGVLLLIVALPVGNSQKKADNEFSQLQSQSGSNTKENSRIRTYQKQLCEELEQTLGCMDGVGKVHVMITFQDSGENVVEKDISKSENSKESTQYQESTVYGESDGREPYVSQQKLPSVEGVLVVAEGGANSVVKQDILDVVLALFPIEAHKVKIVKME